MITPNLNKLGRVIPGTQSSGQQGGGMKALILPLLISAAVTFVMLSFWAMPKMVSKTDFTANMQSMATDVKNAKNSADLAISQNTTILKDIDDLQKGAVGYATKEDLKAYALKDNYATKTDIPSLSGYAKTSDLSGLAKTSDIDALSARIKALEDKQTTTTPPTSGQVSVSIDTNTPFNLMEFIPIQLKSILTTPQTPINM